MDLPSVTERPRSRPRSKQEMRSLSRIDASAVALARNALKSGARVKDSEAAAFRMSQRQPRKSPYHSVPYTLVIAQDARSSGGITLRRPVPYANPTKCRNKANGASSALPIDPRLIVKAGGSTDTKEDGSSSIGSIERTSEKYSHVEGGALDRAPVLSIFGRIDGASSITPGPGEYCKTDESPLLNGGSFGSAPQESSLDRIIKRSQSTPGPASYSVAGRTRDGRGYSHGCKFGTGAIRNGNFLNRVSMSNGPGPSTYRTNDRRGKIRGYVGISGKAGDRFMERGPRRLEIEEASLRPVQYSISPTRKYGIDDDKGGHCWDVSERKGSIIANDGTEDHVGPGTYHAYPGIGGASIVRRKPFSVSFARPNAKKDASRRPLHMGIFARLATSASAKAAKIDAADRSLQRMALHQEKKIEMRRRRRRAKLAQRSGVPTFVIGSR